MELFCFEFCFVLLGKRHAGQNPPLTRCATVLFCVLFCSGCVIRCYRPPTPPPPPPVSQPGTEQQKTVNSGKPGKPGILFFSPRFARGIVFVLLSWPAINQPAGQPAIQLASLPTSLSASQSASQPAPSQPASQAASEVKRVKTDRRAEAGQKQTWEPRQAETNNHSKHCLKGQAGQNGQVRESRLKRIGEPKRVKTDRRATAASNRRANQELPEVKRVKTDRRAEAGQKRTWEPQQVKTNNQSKNCLKGEAGQNRQVRESRLKRTGAPKRVKTDRRATVASSRRADQELPEGSSGSKRTGEPRQFKNRHGGHNGLKQTISPRIA